MSRTILVTGGSSGLGEKIINALLFESPADVIINLDVSSPKVEHPRVQWLRCDVGFSNDVEQSISKVGKVDVLINNAGVNRIDFIENFTEDDWELVMDTNAKSIFLVTRELIKQEKLAGGTILNIVSNAAHMPMTSSLAYNASKAAAHIMTLQMARELKPRHNIDVFGIAPNRLANTGMSDYIDQRVVETRGWDIEFARKYQLQSLPAGEETDPESLAGFISYLLADKKRHKYLAGTILPYGK
jgi:3-oxoacyl-[acyl-carrier protein] reductase